MLAKGRRSQVLNENSYEIAEILSLQACIHVSVFGFPHSKSIEIGIKYG
jgi:hypothetical protein